MIYYIGCSNGCYSIWSSSTSPGSAGCVCVVVSLWSGRVCAHEQHTNVCMYVCMYVLCAVSDVCTLLSLILYRECPPVNLLHQYSQLPFLHLTVVHQDGPHPPRVGYMLWRNRWEKWIFNSNNNNSTRLDVWSSNIVNLQPLVFFMYNNMSSGTIQSPVILNTEMIVLLE